ncbi:MAG: sugar-binding transcriptional regulator [Firmicutes bacterium]|jgi:central glycolytic genes regulator|nr:sugar-binding transcriptional regulator [Bacillota bacterium]
MDKFVDLQRKVAPEIAEILDIRYSILRQVYFYQPVGRRTLSAQLSIKERAIRRELEFLRRQGFVWATSAGMTLTENGKVILEELGQYVRELRELTGMEQALKSLLPVKKVIVVAGDSRRDLAVKKDMGRAVVDLLRKIIKEGDTIAAGGGTTIAEVAKAIIPSGWPKRITVVPTRGSLGEEIEIQADTIAAEIAKQVGGVYRMLNVPDDLHPETISRVINEPRVKEVLELIKTAKIVIHGVGTLEDMVKRRNISRDEMKVLQSSGAVAEMFGYYFDKKGNMVYCTPSMGLRPRDLVGKTTILVAGGTDKAQALLAVMKGYSREAFIIDEAAAESILKIQGGKKNGSKNWN